jgi:hypothetical protein
MKDMCRKALGGELVELEENVATVASFEEEVVEAEDRWVALKEIDAALGRLSPREKLLLIELGSGRASTHEVAEQLGLSYSTTRECYRVALLKVRSRRGSRRPASPCWTVPSNPGAPSFPGNHLKSRTILKILHVELGPVSLRPCTTKYPKRSRALVLPSIRVDPSLVRVGH